MKLLLFSDVHSNLKHCQNIVERSADADLVIGAGDFGVIRRGLDKSIGCLKEISKPVLLVPGNAESDEELQEACKDWANATVLHGRGCELMGYSFYGIGGGIPVTPFGSWSFDFTEEEAEDLLTDFPANGILISHSPPFGVLDLGSMPGRHLGSKTVKELIENKTPRLVVCGHVHESCGKTQKIGNTVVINAGPRGMVYELP